MWRTTTIPLLVLVLWSTFALPSFANTEIINFKTAHGASASRDPAIAKNVEQIVGLIPGQSVRVPISPAELSTISGQNEVTKYFGVQLDEYLEDQARFDVRPWLCRTFLGGCDAMADKAWTARISWPATTPAEFRISIVGGIVQPDVSTERSHDRILKVQVKRSGIMVPPTGPLGIFSRDSQAALQNGTTEQGSGADATSDIQQGGEETLVFDLVVEPLLFGVLPLGSLETGAAAVVAVVMGSLGVGAFFKFVPL